MAFNPDQPRDENGRFGSGGSKLNAREMRMARVHSLFDKAGREYRQNPAKALKNVAPSRISRVRNRIRRIGRSVSRGLNEFYEAAGSIGADLI